MKNVVNFFIRNYSKCWKLFKGSKWFFVFSFGVFVLTFLIGFIFPIFFRKEIFEILRLLVLELKGLGTLEIIFFIFFNNLKASFISMIFGIGIGIFPLIMCIVNGYLLGFVAHEAVANNSILIMWRILPHGIFELPAIIFSIGIGIRLGLSVIGGGCSREKNKGDVGYVLREGLRFFVFVIIPLLVIAGIIEGILVGMGS